MSSRVLRIPLPLVPNDATLGNVSSSSLAIICGEARGNSPSSPGNGIARFPFAQRPNAVSQRRDPSRAEGLVRVCSAASGIVLTIFAAVVVVQVVSGPSSSAVVISLCGRFREDHRARATAAH